MTDPYWVFENYGKAAELIDELAAENAKKDARIKELLGELLWINEDVWPLVHMLTSRETVRARFRRLPDIICPPVEGEEQCLN